MVESIDLNRIRYGCFLPDLTGLANGQPVALLCYKYQISVNIQAKFSFILRLRDNNSHLTQLFVECPDSQSAKPLRISEFEP